MTFNINQSVFSKDGEYLEKKAIQYREQLMQLFEQSPEAQALRDEGIEPGWADMMIDFGISYPGVTALSS